MEASNQKKSSQRWWGIGAVVLFPLGLGFGPPSPMWMKWCRVEVHKPYIMCWDRITHTTEKLQSTITRTNQSDKSAQFYMIQPSWLRPMWSPHKTVDFISHIKSMFPYDLSPVPIWSPNPTLCSHMIFTVMYQPYDLTVTTACHQMGECLIQKQLCQGENNTTSVKNRTTGMRITTSKLWDKGVQKSQSHGLNPKLNRNKVHLVSKSTLKYNNSLRKLNLLFSFFFFFILVM